MANLYPTVPDGLTFPQIEFNGTLAVDVRASVQVRARWSDTWTEAYDLVCTSVTWAAAPNVGSATLHRLYGPVLLKNGVKENRDRLLDREGYYVRIRVICSDGERRWHGFIDDVSETPGGFIQQWELDEEDEPILLKRATGSQTFTCVGMLAALDRSQLQTSYFWTITANEGLNLTNLRVALSPPWFNPTRDVGERGQRRQIPNRRADPEIDVPFFGDPDTVDPPTRQSHVFAWKGLYNYSADTQYWTARQIAKYLVAYHAPRGRYLVTDDPDDKYDTIEYIPIWISADSIEQIPNFGQPELNCDGLTLKQSLDELLSARNSLGYWAWVDDEENRIVIEPFTLLDVPVTIDGNTIEANNRAFRMHCAGDPATEYTLQRSASGNAQQVVVRGAPRIVVASFKIGAGDQLFPKWNTPLLDAFNAAFPPVAASNLQAKNAREDAMEQPEWRSLFRHFEFRSVWNWKLGAFDMFQVSNRFEDSSFTYLLDEDDIAIFNERYLPFPSRMRVLPHLPLKANIDYSAGTQTELQTLHQNTVAPFRKIEAYGRSHGDAFNMAAGSPTMLGKFVNWCQRAKRDVNYSILDTDYELNIVPLDQEQGFGIEINVNGAPQSVLSDNHPSPNIPRLPTNSLEITLAIEEDRRVEVARPDILNVIDGGADGISRRIFDFGDRFQLIEMMSNTVVGFSDTALKRRTSQTLIRDDRKEMERLASELFHFYGNFRFIVRLASRRASARMWPGMLLDTVNPNIAPPPGSPAEENPHKQYIGSVITEVSLSMPIGQFEQVKPTFSIVTARGDIDPLYFAPRLQ